MESTTPKRAMNKLLFFDERRNIDPGGCSLVE
jgi:hypothetical protein